jgi:predicted metal-binding protein
LVHILFIVFFLVLIFVSSCMLFSDIKCSKENHEIIRCMDTSLTTVVLKNYRGTKSQANFASFFILNAKMLELMRFEGNNKLIAKQQRLLHIKERASRGALFCFTSCTCHNYPPQIKHVDDLSKRDPCKCTC